MFFTKLVFLVCVILLCSSICSSHGHSHDEDHHHHESPSFKYSKQANEMYQETHHKEIPPVKVKPGLTSGELWLHAMGSTLLISAAPFFLLFFIPLESTDKEQPLMKILLAFAAGGLLGDAFLHLIPHAVMALHNESGADSHTHSHSHSHLHEEKDGEHGHSHDLSVGLWVLAGVVAFLVVEKGVRIIKGFHGHHGHSHAITNVKEKTESVERKNKSKTKEYKSEEKKDESDDKEDEDGGKKDDGDKANDEDEKEEPKREIKVAGYLNLAADFSHNFTDGLAIGSSYLAGNTIGIVTTITILLHEVPHEIGDFAILLQSGVSRKNAMLLQLTTAIGAVAGTALSLFAQDSSGAMAAAWILPFTAGGFIYIALVSVIPELLDEEKPSIVQTILQTFALLGGIGMMIVIAYYE